MAEPRFHSLLLGSSGMLGLLLAVIGLYGLLVYDVTERRREIGIRLALGASPGDVTRHVVWSGMVLALTGAVLGIGGTLAATRLMSGLLFDIAPHDPLTLAGAVFVMLMTATLASYLPARRAARTSPAETLHTP